MTNDLHNLNPGDVFVEDTNGMLFLVLERGKPHLPHYLLKPFERYTVMVKWDPREFGAGGGYKPGDVVEDMMFRSEDMVVILQGDQVPNKRP